LGGFAAYCLEAEMSVSTRTETKHVHCFSLGEVTHCVEAGAVYFSGIRAAVCPKELREFAAVLEGIAEIMERMEEDDGTVG
jgi:hypothetical protein